MTPRSTPLPGTLRLRVPDHELIRPIGRGAYGEVWLARNVLGEYRAVKIVLNGGEEGARALEREFEGIRQYEPISRSHEGQVQVLHVGRLEDGFYYVMELADDSANGNTLADLNSYTSKTLRSEINRLGRMPVAECIDNALRLAGANAYLHERRLVHRDIKPSNIIFVRGVPKLADIGLVAPSDATVSFVGTEGFLPPEGPGRPQGDLYSLGKVLYEMCTGRDRTSFPELPTLLRNDPEREGLLEFNEVILKACEPDAQRRYQHAGELIADLSLLKRGKSLKHQRAKERLLFRSRKITAAALGAGAVALATFFATREPARTQTIAPRVLRGIEKPDFWRNPFHPRQFDISPDGARIVFASENGVRLWQREAASMRSLTLQGLGEWELTRHLSAPRWAPDGERFIISLVKKKADGNESEADYTWSLFLIKASTSEAEMIGFEVSAQIQDVCWLPNGSGVTYLEGSATNTSSPHLYTQLLEGKRVPWPDVLARSGRWLLGGYSPDGRWLLLDGLQQLEFTDSSIDEERDVWLVPHLGARLTPLVQRPGYDAYPAWAPDGKTVYFTSAGRPFVNTWGLWMVQVEEGSADGQPNEFFAKLGQRLYYPRILTGGRQLVYAVVEPVTELWLAESWRSDSPVNIARGFDPKLSSDGTTVFYFGETPEQQGIFAVDSKPGSVPRQVSKLTSLGLPRFSLSPDGTTLALLGSDGSNSGIFLVPASGGEPLLIQKLSELTMPIWSPDSQWVAYTKGRTLLRATRDGRVREELAETGGWQYWSLRLVAERLPHCVLRLRAP